MKQKAITGITAKNGKKKAAEKKPAAQVKLAKVEGILPGHSR